MKLLLSMLGVLLSICNAFAQAVDAGYVCSIMEANNAKYNKIILEQLAENGISDGPESLVIINIPNVGLTSKGFKTKSAINADNFLSYFDWKHIDLEKSAIKDRGLLFKFAETKYTYFDEKSGWADFASKVFEIDPDCIFGFYNFSFWYICIKDGRTFILEKKTNQMRVIQLEEFLASDEWNKFLPLLGRAASKKYLKSKYSFLHDASKHS